VSDITYTKHGDYYLPDLIPPESKYEIGRFGRLHCKFLKQRRKITYTNLLTSGKLNEYLHDIDTQEQGMYERLIEEYAERQGVTEQLKSENQMEWVGRMNNIRACVEEVVLNKLIYFDEELKAKKDYVENQRIPKAFWKYYDLFRRGKISLSDFVQLSGVPEKRLLDYLGKV